MSQKISIPSVRSRIFKKQAMMSRKRFEKMPVRLCLLLRKIINLQKSSSKFQVHSSNNQQVTRANKSKIVILECITMHSFIVKSQNFAKMMSLISLKKKMTTIFGKQPKSRKFKNYAIKINLPQKESQLKNKIPSDIRTSKVENKPRCLKMSSFYSQM